MTAPQYVDVLEPGRLGHALARWRGRGDGAVLALVPEGELERVPLVQAACRAAGLPLGGAVFPRLVGEGGFLERGAWLFWVPGPGRPVVLELGQHAAPAQALAAALEGGLGDARPTLFLAFDALLPNVSALVDELYLALADRVTCVGVLAGRESLEPSACLFDAERAVAGGVLAMLLPPGTRSLLMHDYRSRADSPVATTTESNRVTNIDWRPAAAFYRELMRREGLAQPTPADFARLAAEHPLGILRANGDVVVRVPTSLQADGSVGCLGDVPPHALLAVLQAAGTPEQTARAFGATVRVREVPDGALFFYCVARQRRFGPRAALDLGDLLAAAGRRLVGATSLGEVGAQDERGLPTLHNGALVAAGWAGA